MTIHTTPIRAKLVRRALELQRTEHGLTAFAVVTIGVLLPATPLAAVLGFVPLPLDYFAALAGMVVAYLVLIEIGKRIFDRVAASSPPVPRPRDPHRHLRRRASRFSTDRSRTGSDGTFGP